MESAYQHFYGYTDESAFVSYLQSTVESVMQEKIVVSSIALEKNLVANDKETEAYKQKLMDDNEVDEDTINSKYSASDLKFYATEEKVLDSDGYSCSGRFNRSKFRRCIGRWFH